MVLLVEIAQERKIRVDGRRLAPQLARGVRIQERVGAHDRPEAVRNDRVASFARAAAFLLHLAVLVLDVGHELMEPAHGSTATYGIFAILLDVAEELGEEKVLHLLEAEVHAESHQDGRVGDHLQGAVNPRGNGRLPLEAADEALRPAVDIFDDQLGVVLHHVRPTEIDETKVFSGGRQLTQKGGWYRAVGRRFPGNAVELDPGKVRRPLHRVHLGPGRTRRTPERHDLEAVIGNTAPRARKLVDDLDHRLVLSLLADAVNDDDVTDTVFHLGRNALGHVALQGRRPHSSGLSGTRSSTRRTVQGDRTGDGPAPMTQSPG